MTVTFFGHRNTPDCVEDKLRAIVTELIQDHGANTFYVGNEGNFDRMAYRVLKELSLAYPHITFGVVLSQLPEPGIPSSLPPQHTLFPEELAGVPRKYSIIKRNRYMIDKCDVVIACVQHTFGGAAKAVELAKKKSKRIVEVGND